MQKANTNTLINTLLNSDTFRNKEVLKGLLVFLHKSYLSGTTLREIDIACAYFKREKSFVPGDDTIVRVNMFKLRQLIGAYYESEGRKDISRISIPKGSYDLCFEAKQPEPGQGKGALVKFIILILLVLSLLVNVILTVSTSDKYKIDYHPVWHAYNNVAKPVSIILGNPYFYSFSISDSSSIACRNLSINSDEDLISFQSQPHTYLHAVDYPYFSPNNILPLPWIFSSFNTKNTIELKALSEVNAEHIKNNNQVFIANINSFGFYSTFLNETSIRISEHPRGIVLLVEGDSLFYSVPEKHKGYHEDYALFIKMPGRNDNVITLMGDFHASGNVGIAKMLYDENKMKDLVKYVLNKYERFPRYFEMIVKVACYDNEDLQTSLMYFKEIEHEKQGEIFFPDTMY